MGLREALFYAKPRCNAIYLNYYKDIFSISVTKINFVDHELTGKINDRQLNNQE